MTPYAEMPWRQTKTSRETGAHILDYLALAIDSGQFIVLFAELPISAYSRIMSVGVELLDERPVDTVPKRSHVP